jgi:hypothetical protein
MSLMVTTASRTYEGSHYRFCKVHYSLGSRKLPAIDPAHRMKENLCENRTAFDIRQQALRVPPHQLVDVASVVPSPLDLPLPAPHSGYNVSTKGWEVEYQHLVIVTFYDAVVDPHRRFGAAENDPAVSDGRRSALMQQAAAHLVQLVRIEPWVLVRQVVLDPALVLGAGGLAVLGLHGGTDVGKGEQAGESQYPSIMRNSELDVVNQIIHVGNSTPRINPA